MGRWNICGTHIQERQSIDPHRSGYIRGFHDNNAIFINQRISLRVQAPYFKKYIKYDFDKLHCTYHTVHIILLSLLIITEHVLHILIIFKVLAFMLPFNTINDCHLSYDTIFVNTILESPVLSTSLN